MNSSEAHWSGFRSGYRRALSALAAATALCAAPLISAQDRGPGGPSGRAVTVIRGATVHIGTGEVIENGTVVIRGNRIMAVDKGDAESVARGGAQVIDATGKHLHPGLIDADSALMVDASEFRTGQARPDSNVLDAVDPLQSFERESALSHGVTTVHVVPRGRGMFDGLGAVLKLRDTHSIAQMALERTSTFRGARLVAGLPSGRVREWGQMRQQLRGTKEYIEAWDEYQEKLEEYEKELEKLRKESGKEDAKKPEPGKEGAKKEAEKEPAAEDKETPPNPEGRGRGGRPGPGRESEGAASLEQMLLDLFGEDGLGEGEKASLLQQRGRRGPPQGGPGANGPPAANQGEGEQKADGPKKPQAPQKNPLFDALREVLEGKSALFVEVDDAADILNLLDLQREFRFRCVLNGGAEAGKVLAELEAAELPLVYELSLEPKENDETLERLSKAQFPLAISLRDSLGEGTRFLSLAAASAVAAGMEPERALVTLTSGAAEILGIADHVGSIAKDKDADLVLCSGPPLSAASRVEMVMIDGQIVFQR